MGDPIRRVKRAVLITGASGGLGSALTEEFAAGGWSVAAGFRTIPLPEAAGGWPVRLDVTSVDDVANAVEQTHARFGRIDCLVNNAGLTSNQLLTGVTENDWDEMLNVNLKGAFLCSRAVLPHMINARDGHIINITSFAARTGHAGQSAYVAAKAGLIGLTQSLAKEVGVRNVRVNAVMPGVLPTKMTAGLSAERLRELTDANALQRLNSVAEVARFIVFLASMQNVSGQVFQLDSRIAPWT